jgi:hypothetical protein
MNNDPRVWKWLVPAVGAVALVPLGMWINMIASRDGWPWLLWCNCLVVGMMPLLGIQAWAAFTAYYRHLDVEDFSQRRAALSTTAEVRLFEMARTMHPDTVGLLLAHRKMKWRIKEAKQSDLVDWVLDADPRIRVEFVEYLLEHSTPYAMMPISRLSDGAYHFDPDKQVTDYQQYRAFHTILINRMMATESLGSQPGQWIEPWTRELVARQFGIGLAEEVEDVPVPQAKPETVQPPPALTTAVVQKAIDQEKPLTDEDMENLRQLQEEHTKQYGMTVKEYLILKNNKS